MHTDRGTCASSYWSSVRTSTTSAPSCCACSTWRGVSGWMSTRLDQRAGRGCAPTMFSKFGGCGGSPAIAFSTNASSSAIWSMGECSRSKPIVDETFRSMPGPPQSEPPRCPGHTSHVSGSCRSFSCRERKMSCAPSLLSTARSGRAMSPTKSVSPVRTAHGSSLALAVDQREGRVLGPVAGRVDRAHADAAQLELPAVLERLVVVVGGGVAVDVDGRAGRRRQAPVAGDVVGVVVRLEDVLDVHAEVARQVQVLVDLELGVDDSRDPGVLVTDEVRRASEVVVGDLAEDHASRPRPGTNLPTRAA